MLLSLESPPHTPCWLVFNKASVLGSFLSSSISSSRESRRAERWRDGTDGGRGRRQEGEINLIKRGRQQSHIPGSSGFSNPHLTGRAEQVIRLFSEKSLNMQECSRLPPAAARPD